MLEPTPIKLKHIESIFLHTTRWLFQQQIKNIKIKGVKSNAIYELSVIYQSLRFMVLSMVYTKRNMSCVFTNKTDLQQIKVTIYFKIHTTPQQQKCSTHNVHT